MSNGNEINQLLNTLPGMVNQALSRQESARRFDITEKRIKERNAESDRRYKLEIARQTRIDKEKEAENELAAIMKTVNIDSSRDDFKDAIGLLENVDTGGSDVLELKKKETLKFIAAQNKISEQKVKITNSLSDLRAQFDNDDKGVDSKISPSELQATINQAEQNHIYSLENGLKAIAGKYGQELQRLEDKKIVRELMLQYDQDKKEKGIQFKDDVGKTEQEILNKINMLDMAGDYKGARKQIDFLTKNVLEYEKAQERFAATVQKDRLKQNEKEHKQKEKDILDKAEKSIKIFNRTNPNKIALPDNTTPENYKPVLQSEIFKMFKSNADGKSKLPKSVYEAYKVADKTKETKDIRYFVDLLVDYRSSNPEDVDKLMDWEWIGKGHGTDFHQEYKGLMDAYGALNELAVFRGEPTIINKPIAVEKRKEKEKEKEEPGLNLKPTSEDTLNYINNIYSKIDY